MTIARQQLGRSYLHNDELLYMLEKLEEYRQAIYDDGKGIPTIGIGLNLNVDFNLALMLHSLGVFAASDAYWTANPQNPPESVSDRYFRTLVTYRALFNAFPLTTPGNLTDLGNALSDLLNSQEYTITSGFQFAAAPNGIIEAREVKKKYILGFTIPQIVSTDPNWKKFHFEGSQARLDRLLTNSGNWTINAANAQERDTHEYKALMSMYFNGPGTVGPSLLRALRNDDRAEAWFEIRYGTNAQDNNRLHSYSSPRPWEDLSKAARSIRVGTPSSRRRRSYWLSTGVRRHPSASSRTTTPIPPGPWRERGAARTSSASTTRRSGRSPRRKIRAIRVGSRSSHS